MQVANLNAELKRERETQPAGDASKVDHDHLMKSATPDLKSLGLKPIGKPGDPPAFLSLNSPYAGLSTNPETYRTAAKGDVQPTAAALAAPTEDAAKAQKANVDLLSNSKASSEDKIRAVDALYQSGMRDVTLADGRHYSLQEAGLGSGHMVHLFADGPDGKQHIVLRGIMEQDGKIDHEVGHTGKAVNFEGDWWSRHMSGQTPFAAGDPANFEYGNGRPICFNDSSQPNPWARPRPLAFKPEGDDPNNPNGRPRPLAFKPGPQGDPNNINFDPNNSSPDGDASPLLRQQMAERAYHYMEVNPSLKGATGYGNCSRIPRQMFADMGINLSGPDGNGMSGVRQGQTLERMGLFREISKEEAGPGDYLYRHWASRPGDLGDSAVVTGRDRNGNVYAVNGAVRHPFVVSTNHGYYGPEKYLRLTKAGEDYLRTHQQALS